MPLVISAIAFVTFIVLLYVGKIGEASFSFLIAATALFGLVLHGFSRLQELDLKNLRLVLSEIKETKEELFVQESKLKSVIVPLVHLLSYTGVAEGRWSEATEILLRRKWYKKKLTTLVESLKFEPEEIAEAKKFESKYDEIDRLIGPDGLKKTDPDYSIKLARVEALSAEIDEMLRRDIGDDRADA